MSRTKRPLMITDTNQACFMKMAVSGLQVESDTPASRKKSRLFTQKATKLGKVAVFTNTNII